MWSTALFTIHKYEIEFDKYGEPIYLIPFGDVHRDSTNCDEERWLETLEWAKRKKRCYFLGMGDYSDFASGSERIILGDPKLHESTFDTLEGIYETHTIRFWNEIKFMKDKLIGLIEGNHFGKYESGITTTQRLAQLMKTKYLGVSSFIRLTLKDKKRSTTSLSLDIWAHHGKGSSTMAGGSLNTVEKMLFAANADIYLMGHDHKKSVSIVPTLELQGRNALNLHQKKKLIARTGSFLKGYVPNKRSYVADRAMNPSDLGVIKIELTPKRKVKGKKEQYDIDIHASI